MKIFQATYLGAFLFSHLVFVPSSQNRSERHYQVEESFPDSRPNVGRLNWKGSSRKRFSGFGGNLSRKVWRSKETLA